MDRAKKYLIVNAFGVVLVGLGLLLVGQLSYGLGLGLIVGSNVMFK